MTRRNGYLVRDGGTLGEVGGTLGRLGVFWVGFWNSGEIGDKLGRWYSGMLSVLCAILVLLGGFVLFWGGCGQFVKVLGTLGG